MAECSVCGDKFCRVLGKRGSGGKHQVDGPFCLVLRVWHCLSNNGRLSTGVCEVTAVAQTRQVIESPKEKLSSSLFFSSASHYREYFSQFRLESLKTLSHPINSCSKQKISNSRPLTCIQDPGQSQYHSFVSIVIILRITFWL